VFWGGSRVLYTDPCDDMKDDSASKTQIK